MKITVKNGDIIKVKCDALVVNVFENIPKPGGATAAVDKALGGLIAKLIASGEISGKTGTTTVIHSQGKLSADRVIVVGLGKNTGMDLDVVRKAAASAIKAAKRIKAADIATVVHGAGVGGLRPFDACRAVAETSIIEEHELVNYKSSDKDDARIIQLTVIDSDQKKIKEFIKACELAGTVAGAINKARDLVNMPSNKLTPSVFAETARKVASASGLKCKVLGKKEILANNMDALWGIAKGSTEEPKVVVLEHNGGPASKKPIALIGKGITFDSGGISLKPSKKMEEMKTDMAGAAAVLFAMQAIAELGIRQNVIAVMPLTENMPDGGALKPGDVIGSMSGKTIEIISTDAEGRVILADAVTYAKKMGAVKLIDFATLTGACVVALGDVASGILGNDKSFIKEVISSAARSGERLWQLPLYKEYREYLKSDVADIKNASNLGKAGTSSGATFIKEFVGDTPWVHIDIAGTADLDRAVGHLKKGPTGVGVFTAVNYLLEQ